MAFIMSYRLLPLPEIISMFLLWIMLIMTCVCPFIGWSCSKFTTYLVRVLHSLTDFKTSFFAAQKEYTEQMTSLSMYDFDSEISPLQSLFNDSEASAAVRVILTTIKIVLASSCIAMTYLKRYLQHKTLGLMNIFQARPNHISST